MFCMYNSDRGPARDLSLHKYRLRLMQLGSMRGQSHIQQLTSGLSGFDQKETSGLEKGNHALCRNVQRRSHLVRAVF
jgi:hypothetical protein